MTSLLLSLGPGAYETLCVTSKSRVFVSPSLMEILQSNPASLQIQILWGLLFPLPDPQAGKPFAGFRLMSPVGGLLWYNYFPVCGSPKQWIWDLIFLLPFDPTLLLLSTYLEITIILKDYAPVFIALLFTIANTGKQPKYPSAEEWTKKVWYLYAR